MIYEVKVRKFMGSGSNSLEKYFKNEVNAKKYADELNKYLPNMYFVKEVKLEDKEEV